LLCYIYLFSVRSQEIGWLRRYPKWRILCRMGRKTLTQSAQPTVIVACCVFSPRERVRREMADSWRPTQDEWQEVTYHPVAIDVSVRRPETAATFAHGHRSAARFTVSHYIKYILHRCRCFTIWDIHTVSQRTIHLTFGYNFGKCKPISKILSLSDSWVNSVHTHYQDSSLYPKYVSTLPCELLLNSMAYCMWDLRIHLARYEAV